MAEQASDIYIYRVFCLTLRMLITALYLSPVWLVYCTIGYKTWQYIMKAVCLLPCYLQYYLLRNWNCCLNVAVVSEFFFWPAAKACWLHDHVQTIALLVLVFKIKYIKNIFVIFYFTNYFSTAWYQLNPTLLTCFYWLNLVPCAGSLPGR